MINQLTPEQEAYLPEFRAKYLSFATDGKRINRDVMQKAINEAYAFIDKPSPTLIILQSPQQAMMAIAFLKKFNELGSSVKGQLGGQLGSQLGDQLWRQLRGQLGSQLGDQLWRQLGGQLEGQLWSQLWGQLRGQLGSQLGDQLGGQKIWDGNFLWGSQDLYWIAWARFAEHIGVSLKGDTRKRLSIMEGISKQCEWWWPYEGICFVSEKPTHINFDGEVLHGEKGPSVEYADGFALYTWRGTQVPKEWIEQPEHLTPEMAITWENVEQRRCIAEIVGWHNVLDKLNAKQIDQDDDPQIGQLLEVDIPDVGRERFLKVECGTKRTFALPVPPDMQTALDAQAWLNFCTTDDILSLEVRT